MKNATVFFTENSTILIKQVTRGWSWDNCVKASTPVRTTLPVASQASSELVNAVAKVSRAVAPGVVARKPIGPALNFSNAALSSELYFCSSIVYKCTK